MTAVRATSDECAYVRKVFQNLGLPFDERDVFIHKEYQKELQTRLGKHLNLPQVIIDGVYIGVSVLHIVSLLQLHKAEIKRLRKTNKA